MKSIKYLIHLIVVVFLCGSFFKYVSLIQNELGSADNNGYIKIISTNPNQTIESIQVNGKYIQLADIVENQWKINDAGLITNFSSPNEASHLVIKSSSPVKSLSFEYFVSEAPNKIKINIDDTLVDTVDTSQGTGHKNLAFVEQPQTLRPTKENHLWYLHLIVLATGLLFFALTGATWKIKRREYLTFAILLLIQYLFTTFSFVHLYRHHLVLFNSNFSKKEIYLLLVLLTTLIFTSFMGYKQTRKPILKCIQTLVLIIAFLSVPLLSLFIIENSYSQFSTLSTDIIQNNLIILGIFYALLIFVTNLRFASIIMLVCSACIGIGNQILIDSRDSPLLFYNLFQVKDGLNVASGIAITLNNRMLQSIIFAYILVNIFFFIPKPTIPNLLPSTTFHPIYNFQYLKRFSKILLGYAALITIIPAINQTVVHNANIPLNYWKMYVTYGQFGLPLSLASFYEDSKISKPKGYSDSKLQEVLREFPSETPQQTVKPNIIFIQNESQSDFSNLAGLTMEPDPLANQHSLVENAIHGTLNVSVYGGGTANTEYEVLTSNPISLLSSNLFPYQQIITQERPSFATYLKSKNYDTVAFHPQSGNNYNRRAVYPLLGFNKSYFLDSTPAISSLAPLTNERGWPSDSFLFNGIKELYSQKGDNPLFSFVVTMQGHGGYPSTESAYPREVRINGSTSEYLAETEFLTSMKKTDEAFADLISFFRSYKEPTIIVMYGDHQPSLSQEFYSQFMDESDPSAKYATPFVIWSNFHIKEREATTISPNYLVPYLMDILSESDYPLPRSSYQQFLSTMQNQAPIITSWGNLDSNGQQIKNLGTLPLYQTYLQLEYNNAIDKQPLLDLYK